MTNKITDLYRVMMEELKNVNIGAFDMEEQYRRIEICQSCTEYSGDEDHKCMHCKCNVNMLVMLTENGCPTGKWRPKRST